ncbi:hypothetical protein KZ854_13670 [Pseudomonas aeruginosa]|uniref:hypothetical protein n=1 Tax=Pseudomonas aeruginosa TaxID=287 RepID=UPI00071BD397|nr:hypothetical protein [Pseudomonas aeruginosa]KSJ17022.1 hypothetical protein AO994_06955 [Pseudomonas aeruginosa]MBG7580796.1 hypothetical protein [Pseudomonas aeruginosa]MBW6386444.1 hypothetical protein [Pseudomonas aeruginosa]MBX5895417.1 hypothetical protein [Pseudomonas aeruginosa]HBP6410101.1 hypothetical protein [Pseudomonas aeruginosa]
MADLKKGGPQSLQASITAGLGAAATASCIQWIDPKYAQYWAGLASLVVPIIGYIVARLVASMDEPEELTRYKARLNRDLTHQRKILKDKNVPADVKEGIKEKYGQTMLKLATANQDYNGRELVIEE